MRSAIYINIHLWTILSQHTSTQYLPPMFRRRLRNPKRMRLGIKHPLIQAHPPRLTKHEVEVLQRLRYLKTFRAIYPRRTLSANIRQRTIANNRIGSAHNRRPHVLGCGLPRLLASRAVHDEDGFDGLGAQDVLAVVDGGEAL